MAVYEKQPDSWPTNKGTVAAAVASVFTVYTQPAVAEIWPQVAPVVLSGDAVTGMTSALAGTVIGLVAAWWVPDRAGQV